MKYTVPQLLMLNEAGVSRRDFLKKALGGAAAAYGAPLGDPLKFLSMFAKDSSKYAGYIGAYKKALAADPDLDGTISSAIFGAFNDLMAKPGHLFSSWTRKLDKSGPHPISTDVRVEVPLDLVKGYIISKTGENDNIAQWTGGSDPSRVNDALGGLLSELFDSVITKIGPQAAMKQVCSGEYDFFGLHDLMSNSKIFRKFMTDRGITPESWENLYRSTPEGVDFLQENGAITPEHAQNVRDDINDRARADDDRADEEENRKKETEDSVEELSPSDFGGGQYGHKPKSQFDPSSPRPTKSLDTNLPFEDRLERLGLIDEGDGKMTRREFLKFLGKTAAVAASPPKQVLGALTGGLGKLAGLGGPRTYELNFFPGESSYDNFTDYLDKFVDTTNIMQSFSKSPLYKQFTGRHEETGAQSFLERDNLEEFFDWAKANNCEVHDVGQSLKDYIGKNGEDSVPDIIKSSILNGNWRVTLPNGELLNISPTMKIDENESNPAGRAALWELDTRLAPGGNGLSLAAGPIANPLKFLVNRATKSISAGIDWVANRLSNLENPLRHNFGDPNDLFGFDGLFGGLPSKAELARLKNMGFDVSDLEDSIERAHDVFKEYVKVTKEAKEKKERETEDSVEELTPKMAGREIGNEGKPFSPQSPRPAQALGPFESRLKSKLLGEADGMSRRKFLRTLVGGAAAVAGAPLGNLAGGLGELAGLRDRTSKFSDAEIENVNKEPKMASKGYDAVSGALDPRSSRPVAELGPFEDRLMGKLLGESDEETRRAQRNAAENNEEYLHHLVRRRRAGAMSKKERRAVQLAVFLGYEPAMVFGIPAPPEWTPTVQVDRPEVRIRLVLNKSKKILSQPKFESFIWLCVETAIGRIDLEEGSGEIFYEIVREARAGKISLETQAKLVEIINTNPELGEGYPARARHAMVAGSINTIISALNSKIWVFAVSMTLDLFQDENDHDWVADQLAQYLLGLA